MGVLPTSTRKPTIDLHSLNVLLYGDPGIGKSTTASQAPGALFFATEDGLKSLEVAEYPCGIWDDVEAGIAELEQLAKGKPRWKTVIIDTIDNLYLLAADHICKKYKWEHESDGAMGKGYGMVRGLVKASLNRIAGATLADGRRAYGLWLISHAKDIELDDGNTKMLKTVPSLTDSTRKDVAGYTDLILYMDVENHGQHGARRIIRTKPGRAWVAKDRTGRLPERMLLPEHDAYSAIASQLTGSQEATTAEPASTQEDREQPQNEEKPQAKNEESQNGSNGNGEAASGDSWADGEWKRLFAWSKSADKRREYLTQLLREIYGREGDPEWTREWLGQGLLHEIHRRAISREITRKLQEPEKFKGKKS